MRTVGQDPSTVERALRAGQVRCPACRGRLRPWGTARVRPIWLGAAGDRAVRPRRARCQHCRTTHVLLPDWMVARRAYAAPVIRDVLAAHGRGLGYRRIAATRNLPETTVRDWLRALRGPGPGVLRSLGEPARPGNAYGPRASGHPPSPPHGSLPMTANAGDGHHNTSSPQVRVPAAVSRPP
jgi:hypothetical protein